MRRKILTIFNPVAGRRRRATIAAFITGLEHRGFEVRFSETTKSGDAEAIVAAAKAGTFEVVVAAGGDGTINGVLNGLSGCGVPLAILPIGTANVLAAELGLPSEIPVLCDAIDAGHTRPIWLAAAGNRYFSMMLGAGLDARVVARVESGRSWLLSKSRLGKAAYLLAVCHELLDGRFCDLLVEADGVAYSARSVIVANGHYYAGRFITVPHARLCDPYLYVCLWQGQTRLEALRTMAALLAGRFDRSSSIRIIKAQRIRLSGPPPEGFQCDGDIAGRLPICISAAAKQTPIIVPSAQRRPLP